MRLKTTTVACLSCIILVSLLTTNIKAQTVPSAFTISVFATGLEGATKLEFGEGEFGTDLYVSEYLANRVSRISPTGVVSTFVTIPSGPVGLAFSIGGAFGTFLYVGSPHGVYRVDPSGIVSPLFSVGHVGCIEFGLGGPYGTDLYVVDYGVSPRGISKIDPTGSRTLFVNVGDYPTGLTFDRIGFFGSFLYLALEKNPSRILKIYPNGSQETFIPNPTAFSNVLRFAPGGTFGNSLYIGNYLTDEIFTISPDGVFSIWGSDFAQIGDIIFSTGGPYGEAMYVALYYAGIIYKIAPIAPPPAVGGKATPIDKVAVKPELQTPYIGLTILLAAAVMTVVYVKKRKSSQILNVT